MALQVHILHQPFPTATDYLINLLDPKIEIQWGDPLERDDRFQVLVAGRPSMEQLQHSTMLEALVIPFAGIPAETRELLMGHFPDVDVFNLHHNATATAEMAMALLLAAAKNLIPADRAIRAHDWRIRYRPNTNIILKNRRALILGYGTVGKKIARMCQVFNMEVHVVRRNQVSSEGEMGVYIHALDELDDLLPQSDIVFVALPLTPATEGLIDAERIGQLPDHCLVVNVARGLIIDERALYDALKTQSIAAAGIDVWYRYPEDEESREHTPPATYPFHELDNVVMSPHRAGGSQQNEQLRLQHLAKLLNSLGKGEVPDSRVDLIRGY